MDRQLTHTWPLWCWLYILLSWQALTGVEEPDRVEGYGLSMRHDGHDHWGGCAMHGLEGVQGLGR